MFVGAPHSQGFLLPARALLMWGGVLALVAMIGGAIFGFQARHLVLSGDDRPLPGVAVLYDTSNIIHNYPEDRYVSAAMQLFASIALMFWYVLRLMMGKPQTSWSPRCATGAG